MSEPLLVVVTPVRPIEIEVALVLPTVRAAAESKLKAPEVAVEMVKLPDVLVQEDDPPEAITKAPVELPILVADVPVALILAVPPVIVIPADPVSNPVEVIVPAPLVVMLSPAFDGDRVVPLLVQ